MSLFLYVFATSDAAVLPREIAEAADEAWYGDDDLDIETPKVAGALLAIRLPGKNRPITVHAETNLTAVSTMVDEQLDEHEDVPPAVADRLRSSRQVVSIELFPEAVDDDGWELLDVLQSSLARRLEGLVVTDDGIFDATLHKIAP